MTEESQSEEEHEITIGVAAQRQYEEELNRQENEPNNDNGESAREEEMDLGDPEPPGEGFSGAEMATYRKAVTEYSKEMLDCLRATGLKGKDLWIEVTCSFRKRSIMEMSNRCLVHWVQFLRSNGVEVKSKRGYSRAQVLIDCLQAEKFQPTGIGTMGTVHEPQPPEEQPQATHHPPVRETTTPGRTSIITDRTRAMGRNTGQEEAPRVGNDSVVPGINSSIPRRVSLPTRERGVERLAEHDQRSSSTADKQTPTGFEQGNSLNGNNPRPDQTVNPYTSQKRRSGVESLMKAYVGHSKFSRSFTEDFDGSLEEFETLALICELTEEEKAKGFPITLTGVV